MGNAESVPKSSQSEKAHHKNEKQKQQKRGGARGRGLSCCGKGAATPDDGPPPRRLIEKAPSIPDSNSEASTASRSVRSNAPLPAVPNGNGNGNGKKTLHRRTDSVITAAERAAAGGSNGNNLVVPYNEAHIATFEKEIMSTRPFSYEASGMQQFKAYAAILHPGETSVKVSIRPFNEGYSVDRNQWDVRWVGRLVTRRTVLTPTGEHAYSFVPLYESSFSTPSVYSWRHSTVDVQIKARLTHMLLGEISMVMGGMFGPEFKERMRRGEKLRLGRTPSSATNKSTKPPSMQRGHSLSRQQSFQHQQQQQKLLQQQQQQQQTRAGLQRQSTWHGGATSSSYAHSDGGRSVSSHRSVPRGLGIQVQPPELPPLPALPVGGIPVGRYTRPPRTTYRPWETGTLFNEERRWTKGWAHQQLAPLVSHPPPRLSNFDAIFVLYHGCVGTGEISRGPITAMRGPSRVEGAATTEARPVQKISSRLFRSSPWGGNSKSKPCFLRGCASKSSKSKVYESAVDDLMVQTSNVWPLSSAAPYYFGVTFETLRRDPFPPSVKEYKKMTKKGYKRVSYRARTVYTMMRTVPEVDGLKSAGNAMLYIPVASVRYSGWTQHAKCARESAPFDFKLEMVHMLIQKTVAMLDEKDASRQRQFFDDEKKFLIGEGPPAKIKSIAFDRWLEETAKDMAIVKEWDRKNSEKQSLFDDASTYVPSDDYWLGPREVPFDFLSAEVNDPWSRF
ncbi:hypothetical protein HDK90DRAFT_549667 [Phyllosticta capitalensis]|uniref:Uncharacterized protein n=1 Tax=Phyllosticta capitalensis TaxID=121624 RepID=A0ABR1YS08_9PEZI